MLRLETPRLVLRPFQDTDLPTLFAYRSDPEVARYQTWDVPYRLDQAAEVIAEMKPRTPGTAGEWYQIAIERKLTGDHIGDCAFHIPREDPGQAEMGFTVSRTHQGQGYATEAVACLLGYLFDTLDLRRVVATCDARNVPSARLLERLGMRREAHFVESVWFKGGLGSEFHYAMLKREWAGRKTNPTRS
jgi:RimJ/RimL family protein N-acetyltransferase